MSETPIPEAPIPEAPPGAYGTINLTGLSGQSAAIAAGPETAPAVRAMPARARKLRLRITLTTPIFRKSRSLFAAAAIPGTLLRVPCVCSAR